MRKLFILIILFISTLTFAANPFHFIFLTDTHISPDTIEPYLDLQKIVGEINQNDSVDFVIVGGDISDIGDQESLQKAKELFDKLKVPYYVIGGNHDFRWKHGNGESAFNLVFGDNKFTFKHNGYRFIGFSTAPEEKKNEGHILDHNIEWMKDVLKKTGHKKPVIITTHYPLQKGDVDNTRKAFELFDKYNVKLILNGHYHRNLFLNCNGIPAVVNLSTLRFEGKNGGYSIYSVSDTLHVYEKKVGKPQNEWLSIPLNVEGVTDSEK